MFKGNGRGCKCVAEIGTFSTLLPVPVCWYGSKS